MGTPGRATVVVSLLLTAVLVAPIGADAARKKKFSSSVTAAFSDVEAPVDVQDSFSGEVTSPNAACMPDRIVRVYRETGDTDERIGIAETDASGEWTIFREGVADGLFYASVSPRKLSRTKTCLGTQSSTFTVDNEEIAAPDDTIFVDADGVDDVDCGHEPTDPCRTIFIGLAEAHNEAKVSVAVAGGFYGEAVALLNGIDLLGGYRPDFLVRDADSYVSTIAAPNSATTHNIAVTATSITSPTSIDGFTILAPSPNRGANPNSAPGLHSVGIYASDSDEDLAITNNRIVGGVARRGALGSGGSNGLTGGNGGNGVGASGESPNPLGRTGGTGGSNPGSPGGAGGGTPSGVPAQFQVQQAGATPSGGGSGGAGGTNGDLVLSGACLFQRGPGSLEGSDGSDGPDGANGTGGTAAPAGSVIAGHWSSGNGGSGTDGTPGGGGGGGGAAGGQRDVDGGANCDPATLATTEHRAGASGGGGGAGGGAGFAGSGGGGGGGSFGIFITSSTTSSVRPTIAGNTIRLGIGGNGGSGGIRGIGAPGGQGGIGGDGGTSDHLGRGGDGGDGGRGGHGGGGSGGNGGPSTGIVEHNITGVTTYGADNTFDATGAAGGTGGGGGSPGAFSGTAGAVANVVDL